MSVINISGLLIHSLPQHIDSVRNFLLNEEGVEIHTVTDDGRMVVTVEKETRDETGFLLNQIQQHEHVLSAAVVYQHFEDDIAANEEI